MLAKKNYRILSSPTMATNTLSKNTENIIHSCSHFFAAIILLSYFLGCGSIAQPSSYHFVVIYHFPKTYNILSVSPKALGDFTNVMPVFVSLPILKFLYLPHSGFFSPQIGTMAPLLLVFAGGWDKNYCMHVRQTLLAITSQQ